MHQHTRNFDNEPDASRWDDKMRARVKVERELSEPVIRGYDSDAMAAVIEKLANELREAAEQIRTEGTLHGEMNRSRDSEPPSKIPHEGGANDG